MRFVQIDAQGNLSLVEFVGKDIPPYAILSHTWGPDDSEVTFQDFRDLATNERLVLAKPGWEKILFCAQQAKKDGLQYCWIDTCCIEKSSSAELAEAINSMFRWYREAARCYVYLADVRSKGSLQRKHEFLRSRWFSRGWTLQELLAPKQLQFFTSGGVCFGNKTTLKDEIHYRTHIPHDALDGGQRLLRFTVEERFSWAEGRETKREEDAAYSLLGLFDIHMPLIYGEGKKKALARLRREIAAAEKYEGLPLSARSNQQFPLPTRPRSGGPRPSLHPRIVTQMNGSIYDSGYVSNIALPNIPDTRRASLSRRTSLHSLHPDRPYDGSPPPQSLSRRASLHSLHSPGLLYDAPPPPQDLSRRSSYRTSDHDDYPYGHPPAASRALSDPAFSNASFQSCYHAPVFIPPVADGGTAAIPNTVSDLPQTHLEYVAGFVQSYYTTLARRPEYIYTFYYSRAEFIHGVDGDQSVRTKAYDHRLHAWQASLNTRSFNFAEYNFRCSNIDVVESFGGQTALITGHITNKERKKKRFAQTLTLARTSQSTLLIMAEIFKFHYT